MSWGLRGFTLVEREGLRRPECPGSDNGYSRRMPSRTIRGAEVPPPPSSPPPFFFDQRARAARRAISFRRSALKFLARATPPRRPASLVDVNSGDSMSPPLDNTKLVHPCLAVSKRNLSREPASPSNRRKTSASQGVSAQGSTFPRPWAKPSQNRGFPALHPCKVLHRYNALH